MVVLNKYVNVSFSQYPTSILLVQCEISEFQLPPGSQAAPLRELNVKRPIPMVLPPGSKVAHGWQLEFSSLLGASQLLQRSSMLNTQFLWSSYWGARLLLGTSTNQLLPGSWRQNEVDVWSRFSQVIHSDFSFPRRRTSLLLFQINKLKILSDFCQSTSIKGIDNYKCGLSLNDSTILYLQSKC